MAKNTKINLSRKLKSLKNLLMRARIRLGDSDDRKEKHLELAQEELDNISNPPDEDDLSNAEGLACELKLALDASNATEDIEIEISVIENRIRQVQSLLG